MGSALSDSSGPGGPELPAFTAHKILIAGGFGSGKTTLVGAISEVRPLRTEEMLTTASVGHDDVSGVGGKTTTTVALDFGRITLGSQIVLYLFGLPGQERFSFMWNELAYGALGAVILADVAAETALPVGVVRVLLADLMAQGAITVVRKRPPGQRTGNDVLQEILNGLRAL